MTMRILHVVGGMNRGGTETWLMNVLRHIDRGRFQMDFLVHTTEPCAYDDEVRALGGQIISCLHPSRPWTYARNFKRVLREYGPYDVVHSHVHHYSGYVLRLAQQAGVPVRIAHSHSDTRPLQERTGSLRRAYLALMKRWIHSFATVGLACSPRAAAALFGESWQQDPRYRVLYCGIDLSAFRASEDPTAIRRELGIPSDAFVVGHVGRFVEAKNHTFLIDIAAELVSRDPTVRFLLVGDGPLRGPIERKIDQMGLRQHIVLTGLRTDVPRLMLGAMDLFLFPSLYEGLPLTLLEAQASGLPCVCSDVIAEQSAVAPGMTRLVPLSLPASRWADVVQEVRASEFRLLSRSDALAAFEQSPFTIASSTTILAGLYASGASLPLGGIDATRPALRDAEVVRGHEVSTSGISRQDQEPKRVAGMTQNTQA